MAGPGSDHSGSRVERRRRTRERVSAAANVPGFPEIVKRNPQCRLCALADSDPDLLRMVHGLYESGRGFRALATDTLSHWQRREETPVNHQCFARHFRGHVSYAVVTTAVAGDAPVVVQAPAMVEPVKAVSVVRPPHGSVMREFEVAPETGDYFDMRSIIDRLRTRLNDVDEKASFVDENGRVDNYALVMWLRLVAEFRAALEAMNRMKNGDRLTKAIIQAHSKRNAQMTSELLVPKFQTVLEQVRQDPEAGVEVLEHFFAEEVTNLIIRAADESVKESCEAYRLH